MKVDRKSRKSLGSARASFLRAGRSFGPGGGSMGGKIVEIDVDFSFTRILLAVLEEGHCAF
jgi:hypothetical protein